MSRKTPKKGKPHSNERNNNSVEKASTCVHLANFQFNNVQDLECSEDGCEFRGVWQCAHCQFLFCGAKGNDHGILHTKLSGHHIVRNVRNGRMWCGTCEMEVAALNKASSPSPSTSLMEAETSIACRERAITAQALHALSTRGRPLEECALESRPIARDEEDYFDDMCPRGLTGLMNLGNTCYFNAAIQVLSNCTPFSSFFRHKTNMRPWAIRQTTVSNSTMQLIQKLWDAHRVSYIAPSNLLMRVREEFPQFRGWAQQDAQELIRCLLELLHRELGQPVYAYEQALVGVVTSSGSTSSEDGNGDSGMSSESELSANSADSSSASVPIRQHVIDRPIFYRSIVSDVFDGQLESTVRCLTCNNVSTTKETFQDLSLPIPSKEHLERMETMKNNSSIGSYGLWGLWSSFARYVASWVMPHAVTLENCLDAFFCPDRLVGEDMYSCEKCKKLRNGVKACQVSKLPEVLCIHLKRFRHDNFSSSKVWTRVDFPLFGLDMSPWMSGEGNAQYELCGVITHEGGGADSGHYIAYCRNEIDSNWYEFDDSTVTKLDSAYVMTKEAYVLVYQRTPIARAEQVREAVFSMLHPARPEPTREATHFISSDWLEKVGTFADPGPITNHSLLCRHGHLNARRAEHAPQLITRVSEPVWDLLSTEYGGGPELQSLHYCVACEKRQNYLAEKRKKEWEQYRTREASVMELMNVDPRLVFAAHLPPCLISSAWFNAWQRFLKDANEEEPGPIDNSRLLEKGPDGRLRLRRRPAATQIPRECFVYLRNIYGGGPEVFHVNEAQPSEQTAREWILTAEITIHALREEALAAHAVNTAAQLASSLAASSSEAQSVASMES